MDEQAYRAWWPLHLRVAKGEELNTAERAGYEEGKKRLHEDETPQADIAALRQTREEIKALEVERHRLQSRRRGLQQKVATLEAALGEKEKQALGVGN